MSWVLDGNSFKIKEKAISFFFKKKEKENLMRTRAGDGWGWLSLKTKFGQGTAAPWPDLDMSLGRGHVHYCPKLLGEARCRRHLLGPALLAKFGCMHAASVKGTSSLIFSLQK